MNKSILTILILGVSMSLDAKSLPDFDKLWNYNNPAETEKKFKEIISSEQVTTDKEYYLQLLTQIARTQGLQKKFNQAHKTLDEVEAKLNTTTPISEIRYNLERGRVFNSAKQTDKAHKFFVKAFELSTKQEQDNLSVDAAHMVAIAELTPEKQLEWNLKAIKIAENSKDSKAKDWLGSLYNNLGWTYHDSKNYDQALDFFSKALVFRTSKGDIKSIRIAKWSVARAYRSLKQYGEALKIQKDLKNEFEASSEKDGYVFEELAEIYLAEKKSDLAKKYFNLAYTELSKDDWFKNNEASRLQRIFDLSDLTKAK